MNKTTRQNIQVKQITETCLYEIVAINQEVNPNISQQQLLAYSKEMFTYNNYYCFGLYTDEILIGIIGGWLTTRFYSGKQLEVDHVAIKKTHRSQGLGAIFMKHIESWALDHGCKSVELNTYIHNTKSHKFYFNQNYEIIGYHFCKSLKNDS